MQGITGAWRHWRHSRKFASVGKRCRFLGRFLEVEGHVELGNHCKLRNNIIMRTRGGGQIIVGDYTGISYYCYFESTRIVKIGMMTGIAEFTVIRDTNHCVIGTDEHWRLTPYIADPIVIGDACMIASRAYIGPGVAIGDGAVIAPNSYITRDVGPYEVWGGNPARKIAHRTQGVPDILRKQYQDLVEKFGIRNTRHDADDLIDRAKLAAADGVNRAAQERDRLKKQLDSSLPLDAHLE
jgi:acetyltransferase-like isoleucine patch superfamily enzyme